MLFAALAAYIARKPPIVQAIVLGLSSGLFVTASVDANHHDPVLGYDVLLILGVAVVAGGLFFLGLRTQNVAASNASELPRWVVIVYVAVWALSVVAALRALLGNGGFKVAALAIVPIVLLLPTAIAGMRTLAAGKQPPAGEPRG